jgi:putative transposase
MSRINNRARGMKKITFSKARRIPMTRGSNNGIVSTSKNFSDGEVEFESMLEFYFIELHRHDVHAIQIESQPLEIQGAKGKPYYPDFAVEYDDGEVYIYDVKPRDKIDEMEQDTEGWKNWLTRTKIVENFCNKLGYKYEIIIDEELLEERYDNVEFYGKDAEPPDLLPKVKPLVDELLAKGKEMTIHEVMKLIAKKLRIYVEDVAPSINHLVYNDHFLLDFETRIDDNTVLKLKGEEDSRLIPLHEHFANLKKRYVKRRKNEDVLSIEPRSDKDKSRIIEPSTEGEKEALRRLEFLKIFDDPDFSVENLKKYAKEIGFHQSTLYEWKKLEKEYGWRGLIPELSKRGRKKGKDVEIEKIIKEVIDKHYLTPSQPSMMGSYREFTSRCEDMGIDPSRIPTSKTFFNRIKDLPASLVMKKRRGKKVAGDDFRGHDGEHPLKKFPLEVLEFDHTILDIMLVDKKYREECGRPVITVAIDVFSRMVWGYYLSYAHEDTTSVGMCMLNGLLPKDELLEKYGIEKPWSICGIPKNVIVDNAKHYRSKIFVSFLQRRKRKITSIWNPPKKPWLKPHVERFIKTINNTIRDEKLAGWLPPPEERRKTGLKPEKKASLDIDQFEEWLVDWIANTYHHKPHAGLKDEVGYEISPAGRYEQGILDVDGRTVGKPEMPIASPEHLRYELLPYDQKGRQLHQDGIMLFDFYYNHKIISKIRGKLTQAELKKKFIVRYDPRDLREVYLYVDVLGGQKIDEYYPIPIKNRYLSRIVVDDFPLSKSELDLYKEERKERGKNKELRKNAHDLARSHGKRRQKLEGWMEQSNTKKKAIKREEKMRVDKSKASSTARRKKKDLEMEKEEVKEEVQEEDEYEPIILQVDQEYEEEEDDGYEPKILPTQYYNKRGEIIDDEE